MNIDKLSCIKREDGGITVSNFKKEVTLTSEVLDTFPSLGAALLMAAGYLADISCEKREDGTSV